VTALQKLINLKGPTYKWDSMQSTSRCPRCGYVLTYTGSTYHCDFCGYPRTQQTLPPALHSLEKKIGDGIQRFLAGLKPRTPPQPRYFPVNVIMQPCANCGLSFPRMAQTCPYCHTPRTIPPQAPAAVSTPEAGDLDRRVFDYISARGGTISLSQAAADLAITQAVLLSSVERLKTGGFLSQS
jgi:ribosomal protein L37E